MPVISQWGWGKKSCVHDLQSCAVVLDLSSGQRSLYPLCLSVSGMWYKYLTGTNRSQCWRLESRFGAPCFQGCCRPPWSCPSSTAAGAAPLIRRCALSLPSGRHHPVLFLVSLVAHCPLRNHLGTYPLTPAGVQWRGWYHTGKCQSQFKQRTLKCKVKKKRTEKLK